MKLHAERHLRPVTKINKRMLVMDKRKGLEQESNKEAVFPVDCTIMHEGNLLFL